MGARGGEARREIGVSLASERDGSVFMRALVECA